MGVRGEFVRYVVVGGIATIFDASTLYCLTRVSESKLPYLGAHRVHARHRGELLVEPNVGLRTPQAEEQAGEVTIFTLIGVVGLGLNELILWFFQSKLGIYYLFAKGVSGCVVLVWNFGARKLALFR